MALTSSIYTNTSSTYTNTFFFIKVFLIFFNKHTNFRYIKLKLLQKDINKQKKTLHEAEIKKKIANVKNQKNKTTAKTKKTITKTTKTPKEFQ